MMLTGLIEKSPVGWRAECRIIGAYAQGKSRRDATSALASCIHAIVDRKGFKVTVTEIEEDHDGTIAVFITANEPALLAAEVLKHQRDAAGLTQEEAAKKSGGKHQSDWSVYERGEREPSLGKYIELLAAVAPDMVLVVAEKAKVRG